MSASLEHSGFDFLLEDNFIERATEKAVFCSFKRASSSKVVLINTFFFSTQFVTALFYLCKF